MTPDLTPNTPLIPDYELLRLIGRGSYGDVWLARGVTGIYRAVKIVWRSRFPEAQPYEREFRGLKEFAAISLAEPHQLALLHVGLNHTSGFFYYVMELADNANGREVDPATYVAFSLKELRRQRGRLPANETIDLAASLARALAGLHNRDLVHRDIKPSNVIFVAGVPKLADIGLVASIESATTFVGTEGYVAPEGPGTPAADVFSFGKLLYELATGLDRNDYPRLPPDLASLPDRKQLLELNEIIVRACETEAKKRYPQATALLDDILLLLAGRSVRQLRAAERNFSRALKVSAILAIVTAVAGAGGWIEHRRAARETERRRQAETERDNLVRRTVYSATLAQAQRALVEEDFGRARELLTKASPAKGEEDLRNFEWAALWTKSLGDRNDVLLSSSAGINRVVGHRSNPLLAVLDARGNMSCLDSGQGKVIKTFDKVKALAGFSFDGKWIVGQNRASGQLLRWSVTDESILPGATWSEEVRILGLNAHDDLVVFVESPVRAVAIRDFLTGRDIQTFSLASGPGEAPWDFFRSAISRDGQRAILMCIQGRGANASWRVMALDLAQKKIRWDGPPPGLPLGVGILESESSYLLSTGFDGRIFVLGPDETSWREQGSMGHEAHLLVENPCVAGNIYCSGDAPFITENSRAPLTGSNRHLRGHGGYITDIFSSLSGDALFTGSTDGTVRRWPLVASSAPPPPLKSWDFRGDTIAPPIFSPSGNRMLVASDGHSVLIVDTSSWRVIGQWSDMRVPVAWRGNELWTITPEGKAIDCWAMANEEIARKLKHIEFQNDQNIGCVILSQDGRHIATGSDDGQLSIWSADDGHLETRTHAHNDAFWGIVFAQNLSRVWSSGNDSVLTATDIVSGKQIHRLNIEGRTPGFDISPDGTRLALAFLDGHLEVRSADTGAVLLSRIVCAGQASFARYTDDGKRLLVGGPSGSLVVVSADDGSIVTSLSAGVADPISQAVVTVDRRRAVLVSSTGQVVHWALSPSLEP